MSTRFPRGSKQFNLKTSKRSEIFDFKLLDLVPIYLALQSSLISPASQICEIRKRTRAGTTPEDSRILFSLVWKGFKLSNWQAWTQALSLCVLQLKRQGRSLTSGDSCGLTKGKFRKFLAISLPPVLLLWCRLSSWTVPLMDCAVDTKLATYFFVVNFVACALSPLQCVSTVLPIPKWKLSTPWIWLMGKQQTWHKQKLEKCLCTRVLLPITTLLSP